MSDTIADLVLGQITFTDHNPNAGATIGDVGLNEPFAAAIDQAGHVYVSDTDNNRVLSWANAASLANGADADKVFGQPDFLTGTCNTGGISANSLCSPYGVVVDSAGNLYVADFLNNRVLVYRTPYTTTTSGTGDSTADVVFGQGNFLTGTANNGGISAISLNGPSGVALDSADNLYVADFFNNRVLEYTTPLILGTTADYVFGQNFNLTIAIANNGGIGPNSLNGPSGVAVDHGDNLYVADFNNHRVLVYFTPLSFTVPGTGDPTADVVFGQNNFTTATANNGGIGAGSLNGPSGVAVDREGNVYIADSNNNRVLEYDIPLFTDRTADRVFGQSSFGAGACSGSVTDSTLCLSPDLPSMAVDGTRNLWAADSKNHRALKYETPVPSILIPQTNWSLKYVDSQELVGMGGQPAVNSFDGNPGTMWHTKWYNGADPLPHEIQVNLGGVYNINGFRYLPRQDGDTHGFIKQYEFYVSMDGTNWGSPVATGVFAKNAQEKLITFALKTGQYVRLRALSEVSGLPYTSMAELNVLGTPAGNQAPNGVIDTPASNITIAVGQSVNFTGTGTDPDNNLPLTYLWNFGGGATNSTVENPGTVVFNTAGTYPVTFTVTDSLGLADSTPATRVITVTAGTISQTNWSLKYVDSQELVGQGGQPAVNAFDGNAGTMWHTKWANGADPLPHEIQINLGGVYNISGFGYLPRQDGSTHGYIKQYEFYVSMDGTNWGSAVATGTFANNAQEKLVSFTSKSGQYVRLRALSEVNGLPYTSMAELHVLGAPAGNQAPNGVIDTPASNITISVGQGVNFTGTGTDPDNNLPLTYLWNFGGGATNSTVEDPGTVVFNTAGMYPVTFTVTDSLGLADSTPATRVITVTAGTISQTNWSLKYVDSQELVGQGGQPAVNAFDGNAGTMWHTKWANGADPLPHEIQINLGGVYNISGFGYLPRQDGSTHGYIKQYEFYVSTDGIYWGSPVATGTFANTSTEKQVLFPVTTGQYVRLRALSEVSGLPYTAMAELHVMGQCVAPSVKIIQPQSKSLQTSTNLHVLANACLDSITNNGWGVRFVLDGGTQVDLYSPPFEIIFPNLIRAEHIVDAFIIDNGGNPVSGTYTHDQVSQVGIGDYYVAMGDSITFGIGDDVSSDNTSLDGRNSGGGYEPILNNLLTNAKGYPYTIINEGVGGTKSIDGVSLIPTLLSRHPNAQYFLIEYGTNDAGTPVPSGLGLHSGDPGYPGTFKDNMQRIITSVKNAGKLPYLAKVPYSTAPYTARDSLYQTYNQVIDELVSENTISVTPPDFYAYFQNNQSQISSDGLHPNGIGYQSMANKWFNALP